MEDNTHSLNGSFGSGHGKANNKGTQLKTIFLFLKEHTATATMTATATGVPQKSICRYKRDLEKRGLLFETERKLCKVTGFRAWYLTTNADLFPLSNQLKMF